MMMDMQSVADILRSHGFKVTPQRLAVYDALQNTTEHPNAEMLYNMLLPRYPAMSLATVYKTMEIFDQKIEGDMVLHGIGDCTGGNF